jgi:hypothetical protein
MRRSRVLVGAGAATVLVVLGVGLYLTLRDNARPVTVEEARARTTTTAGPSGGTVAPDEPDGRLRRPEPGIYRYEGSGTEALSTPPLSQTQGPEMPATVEWLEDGCWSLRIDYSSNHWQSWRYCPNGDDLTETGGETWQRWMIGTTAITNLSTFRCDESVTVAADPAPDQEWPQRCVGTNEAVAGETVSEGPHRFDGEETLDIDGESVLTQRYVGERAMSGAQTGTERTTTWFDPSTGLPVRHERTLEVRTDTPIGESTYTETGEFHLLQRRPA